MGPRSAGTRRPASPTTDEKLVFSRQHSRGLSSHAGISSRCTSATAGHLRPPRVLGIVSKNELAGRKGVQLNGRPLQICVAAVTALLLACTADAVADSYPNR